MIIVSSAAFIFVLLKEISCTEPDIVVVPVPISTQSPIANGLSQKIASPENISLTASWAAKAIIAVLSPSPVKTTPKSYPNSLSDK